jgi:hypothetical protein
MNVAEFKSALNSPHESVRDRAVAVAVAAHRMLLTPIVDDDFPEMKERWELELSRLQTALTEAKKQDRK